MRKIISLFVVAVLLSACQLGGGVRSMDHRQSLMSALDSQQDGYAGLIAETGESFTIQSTSASSTKLCRVVSIKSGERYIVESFCKAKGGTWR
ncbi:MAG TPA: hypothetical protein DE179_03035 [Oceanospirillaceae bacterium]|jgi:hypothetical protein|nr:hypothetical protein [Oceanospirillaceae bacterium]